MVGSKAIMKNKPGKAVGKNQSQQLASGIFLMMEQYGCWVTAADHRTSGGRERCHQQIFVLWLQTAQLRRVKNAGTWASSLACSHFMNLLYLPVVILERCTSVQNGAMHQAYFTQSMDLLKSLKSSQFSLPLARYHWWVQHSLLVQIWVHSWMVKNPPPVIRQGCICPCNWEEYIKIFFILPNFVLKQFRTLY